MEVRCPRSMLRGPARLMGHRFIINTDGYASVRRDVRNVVHGLLWELAFSDVPALDRYEALSAGLYTKQLRPVLLQSGHVVGALIYVGRTESLGTPKPGYMEVVVAAAQSAALPAPYIASLRRWLPRTALAGPRPRL